MSKYNIKKGAAFALMAIVLSYNNRYATYIFAFC